MTKPQISIVIPTFQRRDLLDETLRSLEAQSYSDWECIVVDDGSSDGTKELVLARVAADPRYQWIEKPKGRPRGPSASRNIGFAASKGEFVLFFDSDDLLPPDHVRTCVERLSASEAEFIAYRIRFFPDDQPDNWTDSPPMIEEDFLGRAIAGDHAMFTQSVVWRRSLLSRIDPFDERLTMVQDLEFAVRAMLQTGPPLLADDLRVLVRRHLVSQTFEPSTKRFVQRNLHMYDAYHAIVKSLERHGYRSPRAEAYCAKRRYDLVVELLKKGYPSVEVARRHIQLLARSFVERRPRPIVRLSLFGPVFWALACKEVVLRRMGMRP